MTSSSRWCASTYLARVGLPLVSFARTRTRPYYSPAGSPLLSGSRRRQARGGDRTGSLDWNAFRRLEQKKAMPARNHIEAVARTFRVLQALAEGPAELRQIAGRSRLGKSSAFRILYTLKELGYVEQPGLNAPYRLSLSLLALARRPAGELTLAALARADLARLRDEFGESAWLAEWRGNGVILTEAAQAHHKLRLSLDLGDVCPLHASAVGKAVAAHLPAGELKRLLGGGRLPRFTPRTITSRSRLAAELAKVRRQGFALNDEETVEGAFLAGAPVFDAGGRVCAAVSLSAPTVRCVPAKRQAMIAAVKRAAAAISQELVRLGFQAPYSSPAR